MCLAFHRGRWGYGTVAADACSNSQRIPDENITKAIVNCWNDLVAKTTTVQYEVNDPLMAYRTGDLQDLIQQYGQLSSLPYELLLRILERIEVADDGKISVFLLAGLCLEGNLNHRRPRNRLLICCPDFSEKIKSPDCLTSTSSTVIFHSVSSKLESNSSCLDKVLINWSI